MTEGTLIPVNLGSEKSFTLLREFLRAAGYTEQAILERYELAGLDVFLSGRHPDPTSEPEDLLDFLTRVFLYGEFVSREAVESFLPEDVRSSMEELGLVSADGTDPGRWFSPVALYPVAGLHLISDRHNNPDHSPFHAPDDVVYPALTKNTRAFLHWLPATPCERLLDVGSGTGVAALQSVASGVARRAWASDIADRSTQYAEFNRRLNGIEGVTAVTGDLYEPVAGLTFDRIVAHPPYVPSFSRKRIFRDGGEGGEQITRGVVTGLPEYLLPGGTLYCLAMGMEQEDKPLERRLRDWLGRAAGEFDILLVEMKTFTPEQVASQAVASGHRSPGEFQQLLKAFADNEVERFVYGLMVVRRHAGSRAELTLRRKAGSGSGPAAVEWLLDWEAAAGEPSLPRRLLDSRPRASKNFELLVSHRLDNGEFVPTSFTLKTGEPFEFETRIQPWTAGLIGACDGTRTGRDLYDFCRERDLIRETVSPEDFTGLIRALITGGFLHVEGISVSEGGE